MITRETLQEIIVSQRAFLGKLEPGTPREKVGEIKIGDGFALIITGIRRCGKSTVLNQLLRKQERGYYLNLEDPRLEGFEVSDFTRVEDIMRALYGGGGIYFFDEIQNVEHWEKFIRYLIDRGERVVITGSNASLLSRELGTKLTGRHLQVELLPFSYAEFLKMSARQPSAESFATYLSTGGFPEYLKKENPLILQELLTDVVMRDIAVRFGIRNTAMLNKLLISLISSVGRAFSYNALKKAFAVKSVQSVIDYIAYFENAYLVFTVPRFSYSYKQQQVNPKKVYSIDNGFSYCNSVSFSKDRGRMLENVVFLGLRRWWKEIFYFREDQECDFVIKEKGKIICAIQVCFDFNEENRDRELQGLLSALKAFKLNEGSILTYNQDDAFSADGKEIIVKPVWKWLLEM